MKKKYWLILLVAIIVLIATLVFYKKGIKNGKAGNNKNSQEIVNYILNISSYETQVTVNVTSNKNSNKYILKQTYKANVSSQEVIEPSNIAGVKIESDGTNLRIENSRLNLNSILENYTCLGDNSLDLNCFIEDYKKDDKANFEENENEIIMKARSGIENIYIQDKILYIDKKTYNPTKMEIKDNKQKTTIYILYNEVKLNTDNTKK